MKTTNNESAAIMSDRARKTREKQEARLNETRELIAAANEGDRAARLKLVFALTKAIAYHESGKIEGLFSLDTACTNNDYCPRMQGSEDPTIICRHCYTLSMWQAAIFAHHIVGEILSGVDFTEEELSAVAIPAAMIRFNSDGELINETHAGNLLKLAKTHPLTNCALWTKRAEILNAAIIKHGKPDNMICGVSSVMINRPARVVYNWVDFVFTVYTPAGMTEALRRGEHECNGKKCMECGFKCYKTHSEPGMPLYIAEALRKPKGISKTAFPGIIAAIDAATLDH